MKYLALSSIRKQKCGHHTILCHSLLLWCIKLCMPSCVIFTAAWHFFLSAWTVLSPACSLHGGQGWVAAVVGGLGGWSVSKKFQGTSRLSGHWKVYGQPSTDTVSPATVSLLQARPVRPDRHWSIASPHHLPGQKSSQLLRLLGWPRSHAQVPRSIHLF